MKKLGFIAVLFLAIVGLAACAGQKELLPTNLQN